MEKGEVTQEFFVVISGEVCRTAPGQDNVYLEAGAHFGELALLYDQVCPFVHISCHTRILILPNFWDWELKGV